MHINSVSKKYSKGFLGMIESFFTTPILNSKLEPMYVYPYHLEENITKSYSKKVKPVNFRKVFFVQTLFAKIYRPVPFFMT